MSAYSLRLGQRVKLDDGETVAVVWAQAPAPCTYWAHVDGRMVLISARWPKKATRPVVKIEES